MQMPAKTSRWTISQLHRLPEDGNRYELVRGELFVTPAPTNAHEIIITVLHELLLPFVQKHGLGRIYRPRAVVRVRPHSEVEPDLFVRPPSAATTWEQAPVPILVVEITSESTRRRDHIQKRQLYVDLGIAEYWVVDVEERSVLVVKPGKDDVVATETLTWHPANCPESLVIDPRALFQEALP